MKLPDSFLLRGFPRMFSRMKIRHKLLVTVTIFLIPTIFFVYFLVHEKNIAIDFGEKELLGVSYLEPLSRNYASFCLDSLAMASRNGEGGKAGTASGAAAKASPAVPGSLRDLPFRNDSRILEAEKRLRSSLEGIREHGYADENTERAAQSFIDLWRCAGDISNLILDPDLDSYYLMDICVVKIPDGIELIRKIVYISLSGINRGHFTIKERNELVILSGLLRANISDARKSMKTASDNDSTRHKSIAEKAGKPLAMGSYSAVRLLELVETGILDSGHISVTAVELEKAGQAALSGWFTVFDASSTQLAGLLEKRIDGFSLNRTLTLAFVMVLVMTALVCSLVISSGINRSVRSAVEIIDAMSGGDLAMRAENVNADELGTVLTAINSYLDKMTDLVTLIGSISEQLISTSGDLSSSSRSFSMSSQEQSAEVEEITSTTEEISANIESISESSESQVLRIDSLEKRIGVLSEMIMDLDAKMKGILGVTGGMMSDIRHRKAALGQMKDSMEAIGDSSREITGIVEIIRDISDQINLLSLNAAIEAARAGDSGRGFAVVSDEISKLADSTAQSIKNIDVLVKHNEVEIEKGVQNTWATLSMMDSIIENVNSINSMISAVSDYTEKQKLINDEITVESVTVRKLTSEINLAIIQQRNAMQEILQATSMINVSTQANSQGAEEIAMSAQKMHSISELLKQNLSFFRLA
jgi:methyl-accepting chemotaxis protein